MTPSVHGDATATQRAQPSREREELGRVARGGALNLVGAVVAATTGFGLTVAVTNQFPEEVAGTLFSLTSAFLIVLALATLGTETGLVRFLLPLKDEGRITDIPSTLRVAALPVFCLSLALAMALFVFADPVVQVLGLSDAGATGSLRLLAATLPVAAASKLFLAYTRAFGRMRPTVLIDKVARSVAQLVGALTVAGAGWGLLALTGAWALPMAVAGAWSYSAARRLSGRVRVGEDTAPFWPEAHATENVRRQFWRFTWPRAVASISHIAIQRADIVIIAALLGPGPAAVYTAATRFVILGQLGTNSIQQILSPRFSLMIARNETEVLTEVFRTSTAWSMAISWPIYAAIAASAPLYMKLFGDSYTGADGQMVVVVMAVAIALAVAAGPLDTLLLMAGGSAQSMLNSLVALTVNVSLCLALIPRFGISGAAAAWAAGVLVRNLLTLVQVYRISGVLPGGLGMVLVGIATLLCFAAPIAAVAQRGALTVGTLVSCLVIGSCSYAGILWFARKSLRLSALKALFPRSHA